jgi:superfamily II RNA helicase
VALSATISNVDDIADWLDAPADCTSEFGDDYRPVPLHAGVETYDHGDNAFADEYRRLYRALDLAEPHNANGGQGWRSSRPDKTRSGPPRRSATNWPNGTSRSVAWRLRLPHRRR